MKRLPALSIRAGLVLLALLALLPSLALQVYDAAVQRRHLVHEATQEALRAALALVQIQEHLMDNVRMLLSTLAVMPQVRRLDTAACASLFASLLRQNPTFRNILLISPQGDLLAAGIAPKKKINLADRKHVKEALATDAFTTGEYIIGRVALEPIFPFALPVHDASGTTIGLLVLSVRLSAYDTMFDRLQLAPDMVLGISDHAGTRLFYRPPTPTNTPGRSIRKDFLHAISGKADTGVVLQPGSDGRRRYYAWAKARLSPDQPAYMVFVVGVPEADILDPAKKALWDNIILLVGVTALAIGLAWFVGGAVIARRLDRIADTADRIGQGDLEARTGLPYGGTGIGKVARTIDDMAGLLAENEAARERALVALRHSQERMAHITMTMADWIWETDAEGRFTYASPQVRQSLGYDPTELLGKTLGSLLPPDEENTVRSAFEDALARREDLRDVEYWCLAKNGTRRCQMASSVPWHDETGTFRGFRGVSKDVTERMLAEQGVRDSLRDKEILLKEIHHRVKNNLQIISGLLYLQEEQVHDATALDAFRQSRNRIASMALVHEELYRSTELSRVCLGEYVRDLLPRLFGETGSGPDIRTELHPGEACVPIEQAVPAGLIINELLTNAYKYAFAGRGHGTLDIAIDEKNGLVEIEIRDDGPGLPQDLDLSRTSSLGMQLVNNLARQLRGSIEARNDGGAVVTLRFPKTD